MRMSISTFFGKDCWQVYIFLGKSSDLPPYMVLEHLISCDKPLLPPQKGLIHMPKQPNCVKCHECLLYVAFHPSNSKSLILFWLINIISGGLIHSYATQTGVDTSYLLINPCFLIIPHLSDSTFMCI